jgi:hypothetical protein
MILVAARRLNSNRDHSFVEAHDPSRYKGAAKKNERDWRKDWQCRDKDWVSLKAQFRKPEVMELDENDGDGDGS